jgi:tetratricopeptide (TPR) repeat protein
MAASSGNGLRLAIVATAVVAVTGCGGAQSRYEGHMKRADQYYAQGNYAKASVEYRNAMGILPNDQNARLKAARSAEKAGRIREAASLFQAVSAQDSHNLEARAGLARILLLGGMADQSIKLLDAGLAQKPDDVELLTLRAAARTQQKDLVGAIADADHALKISPHDEAAVSVRAGLYREAGKLSEALQLVGDASAAVPASTDLRLVLIDLLVRSGDTARAENEARELVKLKPQELPLRNELALLYTRDHKLDDAQKTLEEAVIAFPNQNEPKVALADFLYSQRDHARAEKLLRDYIAHEPKNDDLRLSLGGLLERAGSRSEARSVYNEVIQRNALEPKGLEARDKLATLAISEGKYDDALKLAREVLGKNPQDSEALLVRATVSLAQNDTVTAIGDLRAVLRDQPDNVRIRRSLARAYMANGDNALAEEMLRSTAEIASNDTAVQLELAQLLTATRRPDQAAAILEKSVRAEPSDSSLRVALIGAYLAQKDFASAHTAAADLQVLQPKSAVGYYFAALAAEGLNHPDEVEQELQRALEIEPGRFNVLSELVKFRMAHGKPAQAIALVRDVANADPKNPQPRNLLGQLYLAQKDFPHAQEALAEASALAPKWWIPYRNLALVKLALKDNEGALTAYRSAIEAAPGELQPTTELAQLYEAQGRIDDAISVYEKFHASFPRVAQISNNLAMLLVTYKQDRKSLDDARDLTAPFASANDGDLLDTCGWVRFKRGEFPQAMPVLERAAEKAPDSRQIRYHLGMAELRNGQAERARGNLEAALAGGAKFPGAEEARTTLASLSGKAG